MSGRGGRRSKCGAIALALVCSGTCATIAARATDEPWGPPLDGPLLLTATFGEPRTNHLHGGVDFSTGGTTGRPVLAVAGGSIVRVRASGAGYGRALYLDTDRGLQVVYGHLERFAPALEAYLRAEQQACGEYEIDLFPEPGRFRFERGATVAWSGESGAGPPHLHFELREGDVQVNPLQLGFVPPDQVAPALGPLRLRALAADAWVDGGTEVETALPCARAIAVWGRIGVEVGVLDRTGHNDARLAPLEVSLALDGEPLFARAFERVPIARGPDVRRVYGRALAGSARWVMRLYRWPAGAEPDAAQAKTAAGDGSLDASRLPPGRHTLVLETCDAAGRRDREEIVLEVRPPLVPIDGRSRPDGSGGWLIGLRLAEPIDPAALPLRLAWRGAAAGEAQGQAPALALGQGWFAARVPREGPIVYEVLTADGRSVSPPIAAGSPAEGGAVARLVTDEGGLGIEVEAERPWPGVPRATLIGGGDAVALGPRGRTRAGRWGFLLEHTAAAAGRGRFDRLVVQAGAETCTLRLPDAGLLAWPGATVDSAAGAPAAHRVAPAGDWLTLEPTTATLPGPLFLSLAEAPVMGENSGLRALTPMVSVGPDWWPLAAPLTLAIRREALPEGEEAHRRWGLYRRTSGGDWRWEGPLGPETDWRVAVRTLGRWAVLEDNAPPEVRSAAPADGARLSAAPGRLRVAVAEVGSGFDPRDADLWLDGQPLLAEWDADARTLSAPIEAPLRPGRHEWEARVTDRAGLSVTRSFSFTIGPASGKR